MSGASAHDANEDEVVFLVGNDRCPYRFDRSQLRLGATVHVGTDAGGKPDRFSPQPFGGSVKYWIDWIATSEWAVSLRGPYQVDAHLIERVCELVDLARPTVEAALGRAAKDVRPDHRFKTKELTRSRVSVVSTVVERIDLVDRLSEAELIQNLQHHHEALVAYLLLTCFDRLGQPADWLSFRDWLLAAGAAEHRRSAVAELGAEEDPLRIAERLHDSYIRRYGTGTAFHRFLNRVLDGSEREELLACIRIDRIATPPRMTRLDAGDDLKVKWLYGLRNEYTHQARFVPGVEIPDNAPFDRSMWTGLRRQEVTATEWITVSLRAWPEILRRTVLKGLSRYLVAISREE